MTTEADPLARAVTRLQWLMIGLGIAGAVVSLLLKGWPWALGFLAGVAAAMLNFRWLHRLVAGISPGGRRPGRGLLFFLAARYLLLGAAGYVIVNFFGLNLAAALAGLFVAVAAVILEISYELIHAGT